MSVSPVDQIVPRLLYPTTHPDIEPAAPPAYPDHHERAVDDGHECRSRILAECRTCGVAFNWCDIRGFEAPTLRRWRCSVCRPVMALGDHLFSCYECCAAERAVCVDGLALKARAMEAMN